MAKFLNYSLYLHLLLTPLGLKAPLCSSGSGLAAANVTYCTSLHVKCGLQKHRRVIYRGMSALCGTHTGLGQNIEIIAYF